MRSFGLWVLAFILTIASAIYQRKTGPTYPMSGEAELAGAEIRYRLLRSHDLGDQPVTITVTDADLRGTLSYRRFNSSDAWSNKELVREQSQLHSSLPHQPPAGKLEYYLTLQKAEQTLRIPPNGSIITRFKGPVPTTALLPHILFMFSAMLLSTRTGLAALAGSTRLRQYSQWTVVLLILGGMIFGPLVQKYAFGSYWTGFPFGYDLTDNKTLIALLSWLFAWWTTYKQPHRRGWVLAATIITLAIFMVPHSLFGSELRYTSPLPNQ